MNSKYICLNGAYLKTDNPVLYHNNRAFLFGDGIYEIILAKGAEAKFFNLHFERLVCAAKILDYFIPAYFNEEYLLKYINGLLIRNKQYKATQVRVIFFRETKENDSIQSKFSFFIESSPLNNLTYSLNQTGLKIDVYNGIHKQLNAFSQINTVGSVLNIMAGLFAEKNRLNECIILNEKERVCEAINSNIFILKNDEIYTPSLSEGCMNGVMRQVLVKLLKNDSLIIHDNVPISLNDVLKADEFFLADVIHGIRWVLSFGEKRYYNKLSGNLIEKLNSLYM